MASAMDPVPEPPFDAEAQRTGSPVLRAILIAIGTVALAFGLLGIVVPVLPTTPFLLLAAACYARASARLYEWLLGQPGVGPIITEWRRSRSLPPGVKGRAIAVVAVTFGASIVLVETVLLQAGLAVTGLVLAVFLHRIPTSS